ncbi:MAG: DUF4350 domain-containing protein [Archaeoglobaceae archaeon]|nr:DUF4350 domain-containing protein [Archaeoglobaceae archaeon]MDW8117374.1 DUF4350 domain-containing protein [Archaeoglobaceae archaeon]
MNPVIYAFVILFGVFFLIFPLAVPIIKSSADLSIFNTNWNGFSGFARLVSEKRDVLPILYPYNNAKVSELRGVLILVNPTIDFSSSEAEEVKKFLEKGGTLFIANDFGTANSLLEKIGLKARFSKDLLKDIFYDKNENFTLVVRIEGELSNGVESLRLNCPSAILGSEGEVMTSKASVVRDMRSYPIFAELKYGNGRVILFSDPSALMNEMLDENKQFALNLIEDLGTGTFYFDEAHRVDLNPYSTATVYVHRELDKNSAFVLILAFATFAIFVESGVLGRILSFIANLSRLIFKKREELFKELPEWVDIEKLKKMLERMGVEYGGIEEGNK